MTRRSGQRAGRVLVALSALGAALAGPVAAGTSEADRTGSEARSKLWRRDFEWLDAKTAELRTSRARLGDGTWALPAVYAGLVPERPDDTYWQQTRQLLEQWRERHPGSTTAVIGLAGFYRAHAAQALAAGGRGTASPEQRALFDERVAKARALLEEGRALATRDPVWYQTLLGIARDQGWPRPELDRVFEEAVAMEPEFLPFYVEKASYLLPREHGRPGDLEKFADEAVKRTKSTLGQEVYARIAWTAFDAVGERAMKQELALSWPRIQQGFRDLASRYPDSLWNLNGYARLACAARDAETVGELLKRLGKEPELAIWGSRLRFDECARWVKHEKAEESRP